MIIHIVKHVTLVIINNMFCNVNYLLRTLFILTNTNKYFICYYLAFLRKMDHTLKYPSEFCEQDVLIFLV